MKRFIVHWVGDETGRVDGQVICDFDTEDEAIKFAEKTLDECGIEFDHACWSGVGITDTEHPERSIVW